MHGTPADQRHRLFAQTLLQLGETQPRRKIALINRQRLVQRGALSLGISGQAVSVGKIAPQRTCAWIGSSCPAKGGNSGSSVAAAQRSHTFGIGNLSG